MSYYRNQERTSKLVSSDNTLVRSDDRFWLVTGNGVRTIQVNGQPVEVRTSELRGAGGQELLVWQWYWINGRLTGSDYSAKAFTALARLQGRGDDSAGIVVYTEKNRNDTADATLDAFIRAAGPAIEAVLRQTRNTR